MPPLSNSPCKDNSHVCKFLLNPAKSCMDPTQADFCKRTCGLCNDNQLPLPSQPIPPGYPPFPLPLRGKKSNTLFYLKIIDGSNIIPSAQF